MNMHLIHYAETYSGLRSLANYIKRHPKAEGARTLTEARKRAFGAKTSLHGVGRAMAHMEGVALSQARSFWIDRGYAV